MRLVIRDEQGGIAMVEGAKGRAKPLTRSGVFRAVHAPQNETANDNGNQNRGPGVAFVRTGRASGAIRMPGASPGRALRETLDELGFSMRWLADRVKRTPTLVRKWCADELHPDEARIADAAPTVFKDWQSRMGVQPNEESAA